MFKITPVQEKTKQKELCELFGIEFRADFFAYLMYDMDSLAPLGLSQFEIKGESGYISELIPAPGVSDNEAMFILGRQTMNFIDLCGAHKCYARNGAADAKFISAIGFKSLVGDEYFCDMTGMFNGHCDGNAKKID